MLRTTRSGIELLGIIGLEWSTLGLGLGALLIASPTVRRGARNLVVSTLASGMRMAQGVSDFGGQIRQGMGGAIHDQTSEIYGLPHGPAPEPTATLETPAT